MPHIVVSVLEGLPPEVKRGMARDITAAVAGNLGIPLDLVIKEIEYNEISLENYSPAEDISAVSLPVPIRYISINCIEGRSVEEKRGIARDVTAAVARHLNIPPESQEIAIEIKEVNPANVAHGGKLSLDAPAPGVNK